MRPSRYRSRFAVTLASVSALLAGTGTVAVSTADTPKPNYVALGASFSAGVGISPSATGAPAGCGRSEKNFPRLVAKAKGYDLTDMSCGGAQTRHMTESQTTGQPGQFTALSESTDVVTLQLGYNDGNVYSGAIADCSQSGSMSSPLAPCEVRTAGRYPAEILLTGPKIAGVIDGIKARAPRARILVLAYPAVYPSQGNCPLQNPFSAEDTAFLNRLEVQLNDMLRTQALAKGVEFVDTYTPSVGHDSCKSQLTRWMEPYSNPVGAIRLHPNAKGHQHMAEAVLDALD